MHGRLCWDWNLDVTFYLSWFRFSFFWTPCVIYIVSHKNWKKIKKTRKWVFSHVCSVFFNFVWHRMQVILSWAFLFVIVYVQFSFNLFFFSFHALFYFLRSTPNHFRESQGNKVNIRNASFLLCLLNRLCWKSLLNSSLCISQTILSSIKVSWNSGKFFYKNAFWTHPLIASHSTNSMALRKRFFPPDYV